MKEQSNTLWQELLVEGDVWECVRQGSEMVPTTSNLSTKMIQFLLMFWLSCAPPSALEHQTSYAFFPNGFPAVRAADTLHVVGSCHMPSYSRNGPLDGSIYAILCAPSCLGAHKIPFSFFPNGFPAGRG
jgi:hypothetical protein